MQDHERPHAFGAQVTARLGRASFARTRVETIVVFIVRRDTECAECRRALNHGSFLRVEKGRALCLECTDLDHLDYLPRGDPTVTRRESKYSKLRAVVVEWSRSRNRYERQGILVEPEAIRRAEDESVADAGERERRRALRSIDRQAEDRDYVAAFARAVREHFPNWPTSEELRIAQHVCLKHSGRVGRTAAAKEFDSEAIRLAVVAHIRHEHTDYDDLLMEHGDRVLARAEVADRVSELLDRWRAGGS